MKGLDWSNESYARLYRADTPAWKRLHWEAQAIYVLILRSLDRAGTMPLDGLLPFEAVAEMTGAPEEAAERALERLVKAGFLVVNKDEEMIVDPEFLDREETARSDRQRQRERRNNRRDRAKASRNVTDESRNVTKCHDASRGVTDGHDASRGVTPSPSPSPSPSLPYPSVPVPEPEPQERRVPTELVGVADPTSDESGQNPDLDKAKTRTDEQIARQRSSQARRAEMVWRVQECWAAHLAQRERHWQAVEHKDRAPGRPPALTKVRKKLIAECILRLDEGLMGGGDKPREHWKAVSKARGAGVGLFLDTWLTAEREGNELGNGGRRYLEPERAWKISKGVDNAERFAELYFEAKERQNG